MSTNRKAIDVASILSNEEMKNFQRHMYTMCGILVGTPLLCLGFARGFRAYGFRRPGLLGTLAGFTSGSSFWLAYTFGNKDDILLINNKLIGATQEDKHQFNLGGSSNESTKSDDSFTTTIKPEDVIRPEDILSLNLPASNSLSNIVRQGKVLSPAQLAVETARLKQEKQNSESGIIFGQDSNSL